ncbi:hypothetical protein FB451DRAFT_325867 [Mycena latifolia]|nr:hypothetical protein FB451DRAFT_325867 [Mycena latifolia]
MIQKEDTSWDVAELAEGEDGTVAAERPRPGDRPQARKVLIGSLQEQQSELVELTKQLQRTLVSVQKRTISRQRRFITKLERALDADDLVELHESISLCLRGFNDIIFDFSRPRRSEDDIHITVAEKRSLESAGLGYITRLLEPEQDRSPEVEVLRKQVLRILTPAERQLCETLHYQFQEGRVAHNKAHNKQQHPAPDRATVLRRLGDLDKDDLETLKAFLDTNPQRMPAADDSLGSSRDLFAADGNYVSAAAKATELERERIEWTAEVKDKNALERWHPSVF